MPRRAGPPWHWAWWWERWTWDFEEAESCRGWSEASRTESANQREIMHKIDLRCTRRGLVQLWKIQVSMDHYSLFKCLRVLVPRGKSSRIWLIPSRSQVFFCFFFCAAPFPGGSVIMSSCDLVLDPPIPLHLFPVHGTETQQCPCTRPGPLCR